MMYTHRRQNRVTFSPGHDHLYVLLPLCVTFSKKRIIICGWKKRKKRASSSSKFLPLFDDFMMTAYEIKERQNSFCLSTDDLDDDDDVSFSRFF